MAILIKYPSGNSPLLRLVLKKNRPEKWALPNCAPSHSHPFFKEHNPLPPIFKKSNPLPPIFRQLSPIFQEKKPFPSIFRQKRPTTNHFLIKTTHSYPFFDKNNTLLPIFRQKRHTPTHFSTKTTHSYPFFDKNDTPTHFSTKTTHSYPFFNKNDPFLPNFGEKRPTSTHFSTKTSPPPPSHFWWNDLLPPIFQQIRPTPIYFSTKKTHSHHSHPFSHRSSIKETCIHQFSNYNRLSLPVTINRLNELSLKNIIFEYSTSEQNRKAYFSKNQIYPSMLLNIKYRRQYIT